MGVGKGAVRSNGQRCGSCRVCAATFAALGLGYVFSTPPRPGINVHRSYHHPLPTSKENCINSLRTIGVTAQQCCPRSADGPRALGKQVKRQQVRQYCGRQTYCKVCGTITQWVLERPKRRGALTGRHDGYAMFDGMMADEASSYDGARVLMVSIWLCWRCAVIGKLGGYCCG